MTFINLLDIKQKKSNPIFDNKCSICFNNCTTKKVLKKSSDYELQEVEIVTNHKKCEKINKKMKKLQNDLLNCEFQIFCLRTN